ncbi:peptide deformylase [Shimia isoporae]|uniref:Peptide deformylase n=1 Tax=Shimia isoporae TaxID=647720 RepID=A0A4R1N6V8_9RHOB|nr:peptide deformylase [Shimia isoporae]TCL00507.1 peptide deformylase [Shimia isoporae]
MSVLPIVRWPDDRLSTACEAVGDADIRVLAADMLETMYAAPGRGLAGPQVGDLRRLFVMDVTWKEGDRTPMVFVDPVITARSDSSSTVEEGCLSIPDLMVPVARPSQISVVWRDENGVEKTGDFDGFSARCIQHEMDHLDGIVTLDRLDAMTRKTLLEGYALK